MKNIIDHDGEKHNRLTIMEEVGFFKGTTTRYVKCLCECGNIVVRVKSQVLSGHTQSCGCYHHDIITTHNKMGTPEYLAWKNIKSRCYNKNQTNYHLYGGRGIVVCDDWISNFLAFYKDMGERPSPLHSIDRIDNNGNYCKENCRWATILVQANNRRGNRRFDYKGEILTISELARKYGISDANLRRRISLNKYTIKDCIEMPFRCLK